MRLSLHRKLARLIPCGALICAGAQAQSASSCDQSKPHVTVAFVGGWAKSVEDAALSDLAAALGPERMGACPDGGGPRSDKSVALVKVELQKEQRVRIEVDDSLTDKTVARDVRLEDPTETSSALIVAVAIDELLRATWAELAMRKQESAAEPPKEEPKSASPPPPQPKPEVTAPRTVQLPTHRIAVEGALDAFVEGSVLFGGNIVYGGSVSDVLEWNAFAGPRVVRQREASALGQVRADAVSLGAGVSLPFIRTESFVFGPELSLSATHAWFRGKAESTADTRATDSEFQGWGVVARGGLRGRLRMGQAFLAGVTRAGLPLLALEVTDDSGVIGGMTGLEWSSGLSLGWWWK